jgi:hypothetical protein
LVSFRSCSPRGIPYFSCPNFVVLYPSIVVSGLSNVATLRSHLLAAFATAGCSVLFNFCIEWFAVNMSNVVWMSRRDRREICCVVFSEHILKTNHSKSVTPLSCRMQSIWPR